MTDFLKNFRIMHLFTLLIPVFVFALIQIPVSYSASPVNETQKNNFYVALGDSFSSGFGIEPYEVMANGDINNCKRSDYAYPQLVAKALDMSLSFHACQGATTYDFKSAQVQVEGKILNNRAQLDYLDNNTKLITFSIGGNDIGFGSIAVQINHGFPITDNNIKDIENNIKALSGEINLPTITSYDKIFKEIKDRAPNATVIVVGYPHLFSNTDECADALQQSNKIWINTVIDRLNDVIESNAQKNNFLFVKPDFSGHELCSQNDNWIFPAFIPNSDKIHPGALHPNQTGQKAIADAVIQSIKTNEQKLSLQQITRNTELSPQENKSYEQFTKIYKRKVNAKNINDRTAISLMTNGVSLAKRSFFKELESIKTFAKVYKQLPRSAFDWKIIHAIAYSGAKR